MKIAELRAMGDGGELPAYAWPGGYQIVYIAGDGETLCPKCANSPEARAAGPEDRDWYIAGYDPETHIAWGLVRGFEVEYGDIDMTELLAVRVRPFGLPIERDLHWAPASLASIAEGLRR